jgi:hypothetical protein
VVAGGAADKAGLRLGDQIWEVNDEPVMSFPHNEVIDLRARFILNCLLISSFFINNNVIMGFYLFIGRCFNNGVWPCS